jgi:nitrate reductase NapD
MVIAGLVVQCQPQSQQETVASLEAIEQVEVYGKDEKGNIVIVVDAESSTDLEKIVKKMEKLEHVLTVGLTYLNMEDEAEQIALGALTQNPFLRKRHRENQQDNSPLMPTCLQVETEKASE